MEKGKTHINLGKWTEDILDEIIRKSAGIKEAGERINFLSKHFLGINYSESSLIGDAHTPEVFVINLAGVDCFTLIDYVEAMRRSGSFDEFQGNLKKVRYRDGKIAFKNRNHFFTDWLECTPAFVEDVTQQTGAGMTGKITKTLNRKKDGSCFIEGIKPVRRAVWYIPSDAVDTTVISRLKTGDYIGVYSETEGLDVSHVGIFIKDRDALYLRHASSAAKYRKVVDQYFINYISGKPGIIVLRPK